MKYENQCDKCGKPVLVRIPAGIYARACIPCAEEIMALAALKIVRGR